MLPSASKEYKIFHSLYDDDMIGVAFYKRCRP